jgi:hypothetical protein
MLHFTRVPCLARQTDVPAVIVAPCEISTQPAGCSRFAFREARFAYRNICCLKIHPKVVRCIPTCINLLKSYVDYAYVCTFPSPNFNCLWTPASSFQCLCHSFESAARFTFHGPFCLYLSWLIQAFDSCPCSGTPPVWWDGYLSRAILSTSHILPSSSGQTYVTVLYYFRSLFTL